MIKNITRKALNLSIDLGTIALIIKQLFSRKSK